MKFNENKSIIIERNYIPIENTILIVVAGIIIGIGILTSYFFINLTKEEFQILIGSLSLFYLALIISLLRVKRKKRKITKEFYNRPTIKDLTKEITKQSQDSLFIASIKTKKYHSKECRLAKLIKPQYIIESKDKEYFIKNKFKKCKVCL